MTLPDRSLEQPRVESSERNDLKAALEETRRLVGKCVESGFADDDDIRALFVNNGKITDALARAAGGA